MTILYPLNNSERYPILRVINFIKATKKDIFLRDISNVTVLHVDSWEWDETNHMIVRVKEMVQESREKKLGNVYFQKNNGHYKCWMI